jgi:hypothetical protein
MNIDKIKIFLLLLSLILVSYCSSQIIKNQIKLPLDNTSGIPHWIVDGPTSIVINGFDVDSVGNYYFVGGDYKKQTTVLAVFKGNKQKYRKIYNTHFPGNIFIHNSKIYLIYDYNMYNTKVKRNTLYELDIKDGKILKKYPRLFENHVRDYAFVDSLMVLMIEDTNRLRPYPPNYYYIILNLKGEFIGRAENQNIYDLPDSLKLKHKKNMFHIQYLGRWNNFLLFFDQELTGSSSNANENYKFYFKDINGNTLGATTLDDEALGMLFIESDGYEDDYLKLRNGSIYVLGRKDKEDVIITELSVEELYKDALQHPEK